MEKFPDLTCSISARYRKMENSHILFWLLKDIGWCMGWKVLGIIMIVPTFSFALLIAWRTRSMKSELAHNLAVTFWIAANSYWMISEFYGFDERVIFQGIEGKYLAMVPFSIGVLILVWYYAVQKPRETRQAQVATM